MFMLFDFQKAILKWALKRGRAAVFADTGLGKTFIQSSWANAVFNYTGNRVLIVAPPCVAHQTVKEAEKLDINVRFFREMEWDSTGVFITNYEMLDNFEVAIKKGYFDGIGSEGFVALTMGRKFVGIELKKSYYDFAKKNLLIALKTPYQEFQTSQNPRDLAVNFHARNTPVADEKQLDLESFV